MFPISAAGPRRRRVAVGLATALLALLAGCGGGGDSSEGGDEDALRATLLAAANKLADAPSLEASISIDVAEEDSSETTSVCFSVAVVPGEETAADDQVALPHVLERVRRSRAQLGSDRDRPRRLGLAVR